MDGNAAGCALALRPFPAAADILRVARRCYPATASHNTSESKCWRVSKLETAHYRLIKILELIVAAARKH